MSDKLKDFGKRFGGLLGPLGALVALCIVMNFLAPNFLQPGNIMNIFKQASVNSIIAAGMLFCLITGGIDLSVGANAVFCSCMMGMLVQRGVTNPVIMIAVAIISGVAVGTVNGLMLTRLHLPHPFVSTLGMKNVLWGLALMVVSNKIVGGFPKEVLWLGYETLPSKWPIIGGFPVSYILVILLFIMMGILLKQTPLGRSIYCVGGNPEAARLSGIDSPNVLTFVYAFSGLMSAIAGIALVGRGGTVNGGNAIQPYDTDAIAACIIGGASFSGGKGTMAGTLIGAMIIAVIKNGLTLRAEPTSTQNIVIGLVIIFAVLIDVVREEFAKKQRVRATIKN